MRTPKPSGNAKKTRQRKAGSYDRQAGHRSVAKRILIVCEGEKTEPNYFRALRKKLKLPLVKIEIKENAGTPEAIVTTAERISKQRSKAEKFDEIWCVFDREGKHHNPTFYDAIHRAAALKFKLAVSNPAFEFWYILHFECTTREFTNGEDVKTYLCTHIPNYEESMEVWPILDNKTSIAIVNSKHIISNHPCQDEQFPNPSTYVHALIEELILMSPSWRANYLQIQK